MDKIQRATEIHRSMTPHQMALRIVEQQDALELAEEAVRAKQHSIVAVPDGWQLAPKDPTRDMIGRGNAAMAYDCCSGDASDAYQAMLAAAPKLKEE